MLRIACAGSTQHLLHAPEHAIVALDELDLDLLEGLGEILAALDERHRVEHDLRERSPLAARHEHPAAVRAQVRDRLELAVPGQRREQAAQLRRGTCGAAALLELQPAALVRQLELPGAAPVLDTVPQRHAGAREPEVRGVEVGRVEHARRQRLAAESGKREAGRDLELQLALERSLHLEPAGRLSSRGARRR